MKEIIGTIVSPKGFYADGIHCGVKKRKADLGWLFSEVPASAAAVFTTNQVQAAPVLVTREQLKTGKLRGVIVNSGNANACTGEQGIADAREMIALAAAQAGVASEEVAVASTGIIGRPLPMATIAAGIRQLSHSGSPTGFQKAILTTDLVEKNQVIQTEIAGHTVTMAGCAKGSGMIHPNMATMLAFVTTDVAIAPSLLQSLLRKLTEVTFNQITVDGDTSTNDMVLVLANGQAGNPPIEENTFAYKQFQKMLQTVLTTLAKAIAKDGEGATKLIEAETKGAPTDLAARMISKTIVGSPLVKPAIYGKDPNWGRILCAIGYSGQRIDPANVAIELAAIPVFAGGSPLDYDETLMEERLTASEVKINVILQEGAGRGKAWGCDLTYDYVKINALYHT